MAKLRFGIMCTGPTVRSWQASCVRALVESGLAEPVLLIVEGRRRGRFERFGEAWRNRHRFLFRAYNRALVRPFVRSFRSVDMRADLGHLPRIACEVDQRGFSQYFSGQDLEEIRTFELDFVLRFAFGIIRGPILSVARYGIWSFHHGDEREFRGSPAGFWEVFHDKPATGVVLQRLGERLDNGTVLFRGRFRTALTYAANLNRMYSESTTWPALCVRRIAQGDESFAFAEPEPSTAPIAKPPTNREFLGFALRQAKRMGVRVAKALLYADDWNIGVARARPAELLRNWTTADVDWAPPDPGRRCLADPMPLDERGRTTVFAERLDYRRPGEIVSLRWPDGFAADQAALELAPGCHVSYPFVFPYRERILMAPETRQARRLSLWSQDLSGAWRELQCLVEDAALADPTLVRHGDWWWLFCCDGSGVPDTRLLIYFAPEPTGPWRPHALNPVKFDVCSTRPAGPLFEVDDVLYRPAQDCAATYGGAVTINRIERLTPEAFSETPVARVEPAPDSPYPDGVHTVAVHEGYVFVDGKRSRFRPDLLPVKIRGLVAARRHTRRTVRPRGGLSSPASDAAPVGRGAH